MQINAQGKFLATASNNVNISWKIITKRVQLLGFEVFQRVINSTNFREDIQKLQFIPYNLTYLINSLFLLLIRELIMYLISIRNQIQIRLIHLTLLSIVYSSL
jgi:hypothetical protein